MAAGITCQFAKSRLALPVVPSTAVVTGNLTNAVLSLVDNILQNQPLVAGDAIPDRTIGDSEVRQDAPSGMKCLLAHPPRTGEIWKVLCPHCAVSELAIWRSCKANTPYEVAEPPIRPTNKDRTVTSGVEAPKSQQGPGDRRLVVRKRECRRVSWDGNAES